MKTAIILATTAIAFGAHAHSDAEDVTALAAFFEKADVVSGPEIVDCTLSGGAEAHCFQITVKPSPLTYTPGPWCPTNISDDDTAGGIWFNEGTVEQVDGEFIAGLAAFYGDDVWKLYDEETGNIRVTDTKAACEAAARPDVDPEYNNYCVQCLPEYLDDDASVTYVIPLEPVAADAPMATNQTGSGIAVNGVRLDGPAPVSDILAAHTIAPFDDCGGHVNTHVGYHYHAAVTECLTDNLDDAHAAAIGIAMDGYKIFAREEEIVTELDQCGGHEIEGVGYHYHAGAEGSNQILGCLTAQAGCTIESADGTCDASAATGPAGGRPDFSATAEALGIDEDALMKALEAAGGPDADLAEVAETLGVDADALKSAMPKH